MYIVTEIQTYEDGTVGLINNSYEEKAQADSKYHAILSAAAISTLPKHSAIMFTDEAMLENGQCYIHEETTNE